MRPVSRIEIAGLKSIRVAKLELKPLNVFIGPNGAGKSNFIGVFKLLHQIVENKRGGYVPYSRLRSELLRLLNDSSAGAVTTMFDYYGLAPEFPGKAALNRKTALERALSVEQAWAADINRQRFVPYLALHEFEAMLFTSPAEIAKCFGKPELRQILQKMRASVATPEDINDHEETAPSKRLSGLFPGYNKPFFGELIAESIGLERIRSECAHFASWLRKLESLGTPITSF